MGNHEVVTESEPSCHENERSSFIDNKRSSSSSSSNTKLRLVPLISLIFFGVSGGPFGVEDSVKAGGGPLLALLGFLIFPFIWSIPEALVTAELSTAFPKNGGYIVWISLAFGQFWGFQVGFWRWFSGVMDNALYPLLLLDYLKQSIPMLNSAVAKISFLFGVTGCLTYLNHRGLAIVGFAAVVLAGFSLFPFAVMGVLSIPRLKPSRWLVCDVGKIDWRGYFNSMFWNLNYWDGASTVVGEVDKPGETFPKALFGAVLLVMVSYLVPLLAGTGALDVDYNDWSDGYFAQVGFLIGGAWLRTWIQAAAAMSNVGMFEAEMSGDAFQLLGMSEMGLLPRIFASRSKYGTPTFSILCSASGVISLSWMSFLQIVEFLNFLYAIGMVIEFAAFVKLRIEKPEVHRPYKVPFGTPGAILICIPPAFLLLFVMCLASMKILVVSISVMILGFAMYPLLRLAEKRDWLKFETKVDNASCYQEGVPLVQT